MEAKGRFSGNLVIPERKHVKGCHAGRDPASSSVLDYDHQAALSRFRGNDGITIYCCRRNIFSFMVVLFFMLCTVSCTGLLRDYGRISPSERVTRDFERHTVNDNYLYYISGSDLHPNAVLGLNRDIRLDPGTLWRQVAMTPALLKELAEGMKRKAEEFGLYLYGFELVKPDGRSIGVWYSIPQALTMLRVNDDGTIWIETPDIDTYDKFEIKVRKE